MISRKLEPIRDLMRAVARRVRLIIDVVRHGLPEPDRVVDQAVADVISSMRKPGFPCPKCTAPIIVDIPTLLARSDVACGSCGLELKLDWQEDPKSRAALEQVVSVGHAVARARHFGAHTPA